ncbi:hypothetical protein GF361_00635 [Candidatus Woesearchaeota archaeon]|nr:hypothetical protein [Candidatus Woesearchaeota archaeon]
MEIKLKKKPKNPILIEGFPGFGLVGTIASEFLIDHLDTEQIGSLWLEELPPMVAVHEGKVVDPIGIFYNKKHNIVIVHGVTGISGLEWKITNAVVKIAEQLNAKEIISLEGIGSPEQAAEAKTYFYSSDKKKAKKLEDAGCEQLKEGIIMGTTGIMLLKSEKNRPITSIFAETHSKLPDSKASAEVIKVVDSYLGLKVDPKPLLKQAEKFEDKLKELMKKSKGLSKEQKKKKLSYVG